MAPTTVVGDLDRLSRPRFRATLPRSPRRPLLVAPPSTLLLGVFSGSAARRDVVRCTWGASLVRAPAAPSGSASSSARRTGRQCGRWATS